MSQQSSPAHPFEAQTWSSALDAAVERYGEDTTAFVAEGPAGPDGWESRLTFGAWRRASSTVASALAALGVGHGDHVAVAAPGGPVWPVLQTACSRLGAVLVPLNIRYRRDEISYVLELARPRVVLALEALRDNRIADVLAESLDAAAGVTTLVTFPSSNLDLEPVATRLVGEVPGRLDWPTFFALAGSGPAPDAAGRPDDPVLLQFTSGTTAFPKAAMLTSGATLGAAFHLGTRMGLTSHDVLFGTQPFYHVGGSVGTTLLPLTTGTAVVVPERYQPEEVFRLIPKHGCTARTGQGAMYAMELAHPAFAPETFRTVSKGWAAGAPELIRRVATDMGVRHVVAIYGLTESSSTTTAGAWDDDLDTRATSCGRPLPGLELGIFLADDSPAAPGQAGEVRVRGWAVMAGYYRRPDATAEAIDSDGWLRTGDLGYVDTDGCLHFTDRIKDMIKPGGENVAPAEVERVIADFPGIARVAVVGRPDARLGEVPVAFVEPQVGAAVDLAALHAHCVAQMAGFKVPREIVVVDSWPMTESGKIRKHTLREQFRVGDAGAVGASG
jgi:acyl-CoA synthetase (AMP-forming)/AMP-acid ligase II